MCRPLFVLYICAIATPALAQSTTRSATTTVDGDTGLWFVPTAEILPDRKWSLAVSGVNVDYDQGFTHASNWPVSVAVGVRDRFELFAAMTAVTRIDRDVRPLFQPDSEGVVRASGVVNEHPFVRDAWTGSRLGDLWMGTKVNLSPGDAAATVFAVRGLVKVPTARGDTGTGRLDVALDAIASQEINRRFELAVVCGFIHRGDPDGVDLVDGVRWGFGLGAPARARLRLTTELYGEAHTHDAVSVDSLRIQTLDGVSAPRMSAQTSAANAAIGLTWIGTRGLFVGAGLNWNLRMKGRSEFGAFRDRTGDALGFELRVGFHSGVRNRR